MANTTRTVKRQAPVVPSAGGEWIDPTVNPGEANEQINKILSEANTAQMPDIPFPAEDVVTLPGGLVRKDMVIKNVQVKELTGEDEETLARTSQTALTNPFLFLDRLVRCGVVKVGDEPASVKDDLLSQMLIGDRESIILGIREATYGDELEIKDWTCSSCGYQANLTMGVADIPVTHMSDPLNDISFKVKLRKGGYALVNLATGADQLAIYEKDGLTNAQRETILLSRCVVSVTDKSGRELSMQAFPSMARDMSMPDRHAILNELRDRQPGPKYDKIKLTCESCSTEQFVMVTIGHLFLDAGWL